MSVAPYVVGVLMGKGIPDFCLDNRVVVSAPKYIFVQKCAVGVPTSPCGPHLVRLPAFPSRGGS